MTKKQLSATLAALMLAFTSHAQSYGQRTYNPRTGQFEYSYSKNQHTFERGAGTTAFV